MPDSSSNLGKTCPQCGAPIPTQAPEGLCPRCVAALNLQGDTVLTGVAEATTQAAPSPEDLAPHFPQLEVLEYMGRGGMGVVYKARQRSLNRLVALKLLAPERVTDTKFAARFAQEAKALAALSHPNIVTIYDFGQAGGFYYLLMEFVDGVNLRQAMKAGRFTPEQALSVVPPVCEGLEYAHQHGIVHRDIKPENLLLDRQGRVKIADFGIAKMLGADTGGIGAAESQPAGTPQYMAPEQRTAPERAGERSDIYSLGVVLYEMLTGELPAGRLQAPSRRVRVDVRIDEIVLRALETKPELRYATVAEFRAEVEGVTGEPEGKAEKLEVKRGETNLRMVAVGLGIVIYFLGVFFGVWTSSRHFLIFLLPLLVAWPLAVAITRRVQWALVTGKEWDAKAAHGWLKAFAALALLLGLGSLLWGIGNLGSVGEVPDHTRFVPTMIAAVELSVTWLGVVLLFGAARVLWQEARLLESNRRQAPRLPAKILYTTFMVSGAAMALFVVGASVWKMTRKPKHGVEVAAITSWVTGNAVSMHVDARALGNPAAGWFTFEGPEFDRLSAASTLRSIKPHVSLPIFPSDPPVRTSPEVIGAVTIWSVGFVFPDATLANEANANLRPIGRLDIGAGRSVGGTLFEIRAKDGKTYRASFFAGPPELARKPKPGNGDKSGAIIVGGALVTTKADEVRTTRKFVLRHGLAGQLREDLNMVVPKYADAAITAHSDNQQLEVEGPVAMVNQAETFITIVDWPDAVKNAATGEYLTDSVLRTARSFFHACATEETAATFSKLLSPGVLAALKGEAKTDPYENYLVGGVPDAAWEASLRGDWPGKEEAIRRMVASWNRYALRRINEQSGIAMGFGVKHFCSVAFAGAPRRFYDLTIEPDRTKPREGEAKRFYFSSLPPWWDEDSAKVSEELREK